MDIIYVKLWKFGQMKTLSRCEERIIINVLLLLIDLEILLVPADES